MDLAFSSPSSLVLFFTRAKYRLLIQKADKSDCYASRRKITKDTQLSKGRRIIWTGAVDLAVFPCSAIFWYKQFSWSCVQVKVLQFSAALRGYLNLVCKKNAGVTWHEQSVLLNSFTSMTPNVACLECHLSVKARSTTILCLVFPALFLTLSIVRNPKHFRKEKESADGDDIKPVMCSVRGSRSNKN